MNVPQMYIQLIGLFLVHIILGKENVNKNEGELFQNVNNTSQYTWLIPIVTKHLEEMIHSSAIHIVAHTKAHQTITETLITSYSSGRPVMLFKDVNFVPICGDVVCTRVNNFVGIFDDIGDIKPIEWKTIYSETWDPKSNFAIWITGRTSPEVVQSVFETFWSLHCINVIFLVIPQNSTAIEVLSYDPFWIRTPENRGRVDRRNISAIFFPDKLRDLQGLSIQVSMYESFPVSVLENSSTLKSGIQVEIMKYLAHTLNFTIELITSPVPLSSYTTQLPDGEMVGVIGDILKNRSDVLGNSQMQEAVTNRDVEFVQLFLRTPSLIVVPSSQTMSGIARIFRSFKLDTFIVIAALLSLFALVLLACDRRYPIYNTFHLLLFQSYHNIGAKNSERTFFISWIIFFYLFSTIFQSHLFRDLTGSPYYPSIDTLDELLDSGLKISLDPVLYPSLNNSESIVKRQLAEKAELELKFDSCITKLIKGVSIACAGDVVSVVQAIHLANATNVAGRKPFHIMSSSLKHSWRILVVKTGFPYIERFEQLAWRLTQAGILKKWTDDSFNYTFKFEINDADEPLNLHECEGIFFILIFGCGIASLVFIMELFYHCKCFRMFRMLDENE